MEKFINKKITRVKFPDIGNWYANRSVHKNFPHQWYIYDNRGHEMAVYSEDTKRVSSV